MSWNNDEIKSRIKVDFSALDANIEKLVLAVRDNKIGKNREEDEKGGDKNGTKNNKPRKKLNVEMIKKLIKEAKEQNNAKTNNE